MSTNLFDATIDAGAENTRGADGRRLVYAGMTELLRHFVVRSVSTNENPTLLEEMLLHELAASGDLNRLLFCIKQSRATKTITLRFKPDSFAAAALNGHADVVRWMLENRPADAIVRKSLVQQLTQRGLRDVLSVLPPHLVQTESEIPGNNNQMQEHSNQVVGPSAAAHSVMTTRDLCALVNAFRPRPAAHLKALEQHYHGSIYSDSVRGLLMWLALVHGDLSSVQHVYTAAEIAGFNGPPKLSLASAMHDAAVEGRVEALEWLQQRPGVGPCRPDTMVAAIRAGRANVVRWLYTNAPESAATLSPSALIDASRWGLLDVLVACHQLEIADRWIPEDHGVWHQAALDTAVVHGHVAVAQWFLRTFSLVASSPAVHEAISRHHADMVHMLHDEHAIVKHSIGRRIVQAAQDLLGDSAIRMVSMATTQRLLSDADALTAAEIILKHHDSDTGRTLLQQLLTSYPQCANPVLHDASRREKTWAVAAVLESGILGNWSIAQVFGLALTLRPSFAELMLVDIPKLWPIALPLVASRGRLDMLLRHYPYRTRDLAIVALEAAPTLAVASFLVRREDRFYTEAVLLASLPSILSAAFVRYLLKHGRRDDRDKVRSFADVLHEENSPLTFDELRQVQDRQDPALDAFVQKHSASLVAVDKIEATSEMTLYLQTIGVVVPPVSP